MSNEIPARWKEFLTEIDESLEEQTKLHCIGGFVIRALYNFARETSDLDFIDCIPKGNQQRLYDLAGKGSPLFQKYQVYLDPVGVAQMPYSYEDRLIEMFPGNFKNLRLYALDPYDLALTKLERSAQHDLEDVIHLAKIVPFDLEIFKQRYDEEMRIYLEDGRHRHTFGHWIDILEEERNRNTKTAER